MQGADLQPIISGELRAEHLIGATSVEACTMQGSSRSWPRGTVKPIQAAGAIQNPLPEAVDWPRLGWFRTGSGARAMQAAGLTRNQMTEQGSPSTCPCANPAWLDDHPTARGTLRTGRASDSLAGLVSAGRSAMRLGSNLGLSLGDCRQSRPAANDVGLSCGEAAMAGGIGASEPF